MIKIRPDTDESLCLSCKNATSIRGDSFKQHLVICHDPYPAVRIEFPVRNCNAYVNRSDTGLRDLYDAAWILRTDKTSKTIGFVPFKDLTQEEKDRMI